MKSSKDYQGLTSLRLLAGLLVIATVSILWLSPSAFTSNRAAAQVPSGVHIENSGAGSHARLFGSGGVASADMAAGTVYVQLNPSNPSVAKDQIFTVAIQIVAGSQPVDGAEVHLDFNPLYLRVVDSAGNPASSIESSGVLDVPIQNSVNNAAGQIDFAAGTFSATPPSGTFTLAMIRFKALWGTGGGSTPLTFVTQLPRKTDVTYGGGSVLAGTTDGSVTISGEIPPATPTVTPTPTNTALPGRIVYIALNPSNSAVAKDQIFTLDIQILAGSQPVDGAEVHLDFNPLYLRVVDDVGNPASSIESSGILDVPIQNSVNNASGQIDFAAGTFSATPPSGTFTLAMIRFKALWGTGGGSTPLTFVTQLPRKTDVTYGGGSVLAGTTDGSVTISGETPPATPTHTATPTRTATATQTATPTVTPTPVGPPRKEWFYCAKDNDTFLSIDDPNTPQYGSIYLKMKNDNEGGMRPLLRFDLSAIPQGSVVVTGVLHLCQNDYKKNPDFNSTVSAYKVLRHWVGREATWYKATATDRWELPGANAASDHAMEVADSVVMTVLPTGQRLWRLWNIRGLVQDWVDDPAHNEGVILVGSGDSQEFRFISADSASTDLHPKLEVHYYPAPPTPTPTRTATPTNTPTATPTLTPTPVPGRIEGRVWNDLNGDGVMDAGEPGLAGATLRLYDYAHPAPEPPIRPAIGTGADGSFGFADLPPGWYILMVTNPNGYLPTTPDTLTILVSSGALTQSNFGAWIPSTATPTASPTASPTPTGTVLPTPTETILRPYKVFLPIIRRG